jgi:beta propeller repeat protein
MKARTFLSAVSVGFMLAIVICSTALAASPQRRSGGRAMAYIHDLVREQSRESGEARVIVVLGSPSLPQAWARDWRARGPAVNELTRRVQAEAPHFRVTHRYQIFPFVGGRADERALKELAASGVVEAVYPDREQYAVLSESGPLIGQPIVEGAGYDGSGIGIAVIDTGVDYTHPDLGGGAFPNAKVVAGYDFVNSDSLPMDDNGHGTYVSSIAAGTGSVYRGIAPGAHIVALKVLNSTGLGYSTDIIAALQWCVTNKDAYNIKVANLSLSDSAEWQDPTQCDADPEGEAVSTAVANGIVVAVAAGNSGYKRGVGMPACASDAIAVGASNDGGPTPPGQTEPATPVDGIAYFSNRGELLDVYAPGIWITAARWSADPIGSGLYLTEAGTSSATPHVSGAAALLFEILGPGATPGDVAARLKRTGVQIIDPSTGVATPRINLVTAMNNEPTSGPDLVVTALTGSSPSGVQDASTNVTVTVKNQGDTGSGACEAVVAISENRVPSPQDSPVIALDVPALAAGDSWSSGSVAGSVPRIQPGSYWLVAFADSDYQVSEKDETNNGRLGAAFTVQAFSSYVQGTTIPLSLLKGQSYPVSVTMWNDGTVPWTAAEGCRLVAASPFGNDTWGISEVALPTSSVPAGGTVTFNFVVTAPASTGLYPCYWQMARGSEPFGEIATGATKTRVIDDPQWGQNWPAISGDWVAYEDYRPRVPEYPYLDSAISATNLISQGTVRMPHDIPFPRDSSYVPLPPYENFDISYHYYPDVSGSWVTWVVDDYPPVQVDDPWFYEITAANVLDLSVLPLRITFQGNDAVFPAIDGKLVVWQDYRNDPDGVIDPDGKWERDNPDVYICDISDVAGPTDHSPPTYPLCTAPGPQFDPRISGSYVVWEDWRDLTQSDIYMYDLSVDSDGDGIPNWKEAARPSPDPAEVRLTSTPWSEQFPDISGRTVVYMDLARYAGARDPIDIYALTIDSPTPVAVATDPPAFRYRPRISHPLLVWEDYANDADGPTGDGLSDNPDVDFYNLDAGVGGPIAGSAGIEGGPDISGSRVSYARVRAVVTHVDQGGVPREWPVFNTWVQQLGTEGMTGVVTFTDVPATWWAWKQVEAAVEHDVVQGYVDGTYQPTWTVTRDQMAVYIARALAGGDAFFDTYVPPGGPSFSDVSTSHWAYKYIEYCADPAQGVVTGFEDGTYQPGQAVNRGQMAAFIARALEGGEAFFQTYVPPSGPTFPDVPESFWAYKYVEYIANAGVTQGYPDGKYHPEVNVTRDQMAVYISKAFGYL